MPWVKDIDLEERFNKAQSLFEEAHGSLTYEKQQEFRRVAIQVGSVQASLIKSLNVLLHLINTRRKEHKTYLLAAIPLALLYYGARYFEVIPQGRIDSGLLFAFLIFSYFELRQQIRISAERVTTKLLLKDWIALGQYENLARALAQPIEDNLQEAILYLETELCVLEHMGIKIKRSNLKPIWTPGENDFWDEL